MGFSPSTRPWDLGFDQFLVAGGKNKQRGVRETMERMNVKGGGLNLIILIFINE